MDPNNDHIGDEELLSFSDGETSPHRVAAVEAHLEICASCRARKSTMERTLAEFRQIQDQRFSPQIPPGLGPRNRLRLRLQEAGTASNPQEWLRALPGKVWGQWGVGLAALALLLVGSALWVAYSPRRPEAAEARLSPRADLTPGAVRPVALRDICGERPSDKNRPVPVAVQQQVFREYGIPNARPEDYEVDYLITPELGGASDIRNLWPQPFASAPWSAYRKDDLEDRLHELVCAGSLDLGSAQREIATDWIAAYKKYVKPGKALEPAHGVSSRRLALQMANAAWIH